MHIPRAKLASLIENTPNWREVLSHLVDERHHDVAKQWAFGAAVEFRDVRNDRWTLVNEPSWMDIYEYRVHQRPDRSSVD